MEWTDASLKLYSSRRDSIYAYWLRWMDTLLWVSLKKVMDRSVECCFDFISEFSLKCFFHFHRLREVDHVVNVQPKVEGWLSLNKNACEDAWSVGAWSKPDRD